MNWKRIVSGVFVICIGLWACKKNTSIQEKESIITTYNNYEADWTAVKKMENKGLGKTIVAKIDSILAKALKEENTAQIFKALAHRSKYYNTLLEESNLKIFEQFESQVSTAQFPLKQLLHSATAELYYQYYQANRWEFQSRTSTQNFNPKDLRSWSLQHILDKVDFNYQNSLTEKENLLAYPIENLKDILHLPQVQKTHNQFDGTYLTPSLFDFLANRSLTYYKTNEGRVSTPQDEFKIEGYPVLCNAEDFLKLEFTTADSSSNDLKTAQIFQEIIKSHLKDDDQNALLHIDLSRLQHYYTSSQLDNKDSLYLKALKELSITHAESKNRAEIAYAEAKFYSNKGRDYSRYQENEEKRWLQKKAHAICSEFANDKTYGGIQCQNLKTQIETKQLDIKTEQVHLPKQKISYQITARNIDSVHCKLVQIANTIDEHKNRDEQNSAYLKRLDKLTALKSWTQVLTNPKDFHEHNYEFSIKGLDRGKYLILVSEDQNFSNEADPTFVMGFSVSELSFVHKPDPKDNFHKLYVLNRATGKAIPQAKISTYLRKHDYKTRSYEISNLGKFTTDKDGRVNLPKASRNESYQVSVSHLNDTLIPGNQFYHNSQRGKKKKQIKTKLFTDRAIYRPGQIVYFKGIIMELGENQHQVVPNQKAEVKLYNVNREELSNLKLTSNEYGSFQGNFTLPTSGLNGNYRIQTEGGVHYFSVEEYKRPTFELTVDSSTTTPKINQDVTINGNVLAFSGARISDAKISYRIVRKAVYPYWGYWRSYLPPTNQKEIANGVVSSDDDGKFNISFFATADENLKNKWNPNFNFQIILDATSPSGETQSLTENITLGNKLIYLSSNLSESLQIRELKEFIIYSKNIQGVKVNQKLKFNLHRLEVPKKLNLSEYWSKSEYIDKVSSEKGDRLRDYEKGTELLKGSINSNEQNNIIGNLPVGAYELTATSETDEAIRFSHRFELFDENSKQLAIPQILELKLLKNNVEPGETAEFLIGSGLQNARLLYMVSLKGEVIEERWIQLNQEQRKISIPIKEKYRGGISIQFIGVHSNRVLNANNNINVPFTNKKLQLTLGTYRNKVEPGSKEKWTMTITGMKGEKIAAELLAGMYDESLDQFKTDNWKLNLYNPNYNRTSWSSDASFKINSATQFGYYRNNNQTPNRAFPNLNWFGFSLNRNFRYRGAISNTMAMSMQKSGNIEGDIESETMMMADAEAVPMTYQQASGDDTAVLKEKDTANEKPKNANPLRTDFRETAFFYPQLKTDKNGAVSFEFEMPDALTKWKFRALAHTKDLRVGTTETSIQTQKELMVSPTFPRFFREGDELNLKVLITNLSENIQDGIAKIRFYDAFTNEPISIALDNAGDQKFNLLSGKNTSVQWSVKIPKGLQAIKYQVTAKSANFSDGEEKAIPVLSNRMLVTETLPLAIRGNQQKTFKFDKLLQTKSSSLSHQSFSLEFTGNPIWYVVQALPYVAETGNECSEQVFARLYANLLAQKIANSNPRIKQIFETWRNLNSKELTSKLMQNQELKSILIEETPWLQEAKSENEQKQKIALLFDMNRMANEKTEALKKLKELQLPNGGWAWYKGMRDSRYISQYIVNGFGHLKQLGVDLNQEPGVDELLKKAVRYLDEQISEDYNWLKKHNKDLSKNHLGNLQIQYLYTRSFFLEYDLPQKPEAFNYYLKQADQYWLERSLSVKGMQALAVFRLNPKSATPKAIVASLRDNAIQSEQLGMYWKENAAGYYWYNSPIEAQALMIELFQEVAEDKNAIEELRIWLLKEKQTQQWSNSKATALACYALLLNNKSAITSVSNVQVMVNNKVLNATNKEAGTGYFKQVWTKTEVTPELGTILVNKDDDGIAWGAAYWQYYEDLDRITSAVVDEFSVSKTLFKVVVDAKGEKMLPIDVSGIEIGDKIRIRLRIESKRNLEFVHLKDMRASGFDPINVISSYKYQDGLGYYESTKDASTNFFMDHLSKGVYVFEYDLRATISGKFSNGICTLQCQYAPEFTTHSKGKQVIIK